MLGTDAANRLITTTKDLPLEVAVYVVWAHKIYYVLQCWVGDLRVDGVPAPPVEILNACERHPPHAPPVIQLLQA